MTGRTVDSETQRAIDRLSNQPHHSSEYKAKAKLILDLYTRVFITDQFDQALPLFGRRYIQHNPIIADGVEGLRPWAKERANEGAKIEFLRLMVDNDLVFVHVRVFRTPKDLGLAVADLFRIENGKVVEHWDVWQDVPPDPKNDNTMF
jgi:predicted SnoaL-like aldol condensation-catalyzing enzyme